MSDLAPRSHEDLLTAAPASLPQQVLLVAHRAFATAITLLAYCALVVVGVIRHEPWADEAYAWVLSRDVAYRDLVFRQLAYYGHPPMWNTILWVAIHWFHLPYQSLGWIGASFAILGVWFFCQYSPFPTWVRMLFPFTYFMAFQFAIVARPYVLLPLFTFAAAYFFADAEHRPWRFVASTSALSFLCAPGVMIAVGLAASRAWYTLRSWNALEPQVRKKITAAAVVFVLVLAFIAFVNWPPADRSEVQTSRVHDDKTFGLSTLSRDLSLAFLGSALPSMALLLVIGSWCACRGRLLPLALPTTLLLAFFVIVYGNLWHCGALTLAALAAFWIAWPQQGRCPPNLQRAIQVLALVGIGAFLSVQIYWTARTVALDYSQPYSGSLDAASFLRSVRADRNSTCGFGFHSVALQPYFPQNIYKNWPDGEAFWRFEISNRDNQNCFQPTWLVVPICCSLDKGLEDFGRQDTYLRSSGYFPVHYSRGRMYFEGREVEPNDFVIYKRAGGTVPER